MLILIALVLGALYYRRSKTKEEALRMPQNNRGEGHTNPVYDGSGDYASRNIYRDIAPADESSIDADIAPADGAPIDAAAPSNTIYRDIAPADSSAIYAVAPVRAASFPSATYGTASTFASGFRNPNEVTAHEALDSANALYDAPPAAATASAEDPDADFGIAPFEASRETSGGYRVKSVIPKPQLSRRSRISSV